MSNHRGVCDDQPAAGFTLVELCVVMAIIAVLIAILMPSMHSAIELARQVRCASNQRQISTAYLAFITDHERHLPIGIPGGAEGTSNEYFVAAGNRYQDIAYGALYRYIGQHTIAELNALTVDQREKLLEDDPAVKLFKCTNDPNPNKRSYSIVAPLRGENWSDWSGSSWAPQAGTDRLSAIVNPSAQLVFVEDADYRSSYNVGSWMMYVTDSMKWRWIDYVAPFHQNQTAQNMAFADGHIENWRWVDETTLHAAQVGFSYAGQGYTGAMNPPFFQISYNHGSDWARMRSAYRQIAPNDDPRILYYRNAEAVQ